MSITIVKTLTISLLLRRSVQDLSKTNLSRIKHLVARCSYPCTNYERSRLLNIFDKKALASMAISDSKKTHRFVGKDHCSFHFLLKITLYIEDFQKNKLLEIEYDIVAVLRNNPMISL